MIDFPKLYEVRVLMHARPAEMVHDCARRALAASGMTTEDLAWILASYELQKPRIYERTMTDGVRVSEAVG